MTFKARCRCSLCVVFDADQPRLDRVAEVKRKIASEGPESYVALRLEGLEARLTDALPTEDSQ